MPACGPIHSQWQHIFSKGDCQRWTVSQRRTVPAQRLRDTADEELAAPLETFVAAAHREPDIAEELDRADEAAEAEADEETASLAHQTTAAESPRQSGSPNNWRILSVAHCELVDAAEELSGGRRVISKVRRTIDAENPAGCGFADVSLFQPSLRH